MNRNRKPLTAALHIENLIKGGDTMKRKKNKSGIPQHEIEALARCLLPDIQRFFESEEGQKEFAKWKKEQAEKKKSAKAT